MKKEIVALLACLCFSVPLFATDYPASAIEKRGDIFYVKETGKPLTGTLIRTYPSGKKLAESVFAEGILNGESRGFQENGKIDHIIGFKNNVKDGVYKQYDSAGILRVEGVYQAGHLTDTLKIYYPSGKLQVSESYQNGALNGERVEYYETGTPKSKAFFKDNQLDGLFQEFYADGKQQSEITFEKGMRHGPAKVFYPNGKIRYAMNFNQNKLDGENNEYDATGALKETRMYQNGMALSGKTVKNGQQISLKTAQLDELNSKSILHTPQNTYKEKGILYDSKTKKPISGIFRVTYPTGGIQEEYEFINGRPHGISQFFNEKGHLTQQNLFNNGVKIGYRLMNEKGVVIQSCQIDEKGTEKCN